MIAKLQVRKRLSTGSLAKPHITGHARPLSSYPGKENIPPIRVSSTTVGVVRTKRITSTRRTVSRSGSTSGECRIHLSSVAATCFFAGPSQSRLECMCPDIISLVLLPDLFTNVYSDDTTS
ncbi:hypothetical protein FRB95_011924 [Tulasnella sp. JGI-2019a]|nr:hypothetical protein FRB95_011924 [Tulasnella sp. JGI-2019a]